MSVQPFVWSGWAGFGKVPGSFGWEGFLRFILAQFSVVANSHCEVAMAPLALAPNQHVTGVWLVGVSLFRFSLGVLRGLLCVPLCVCFEQFW